MKDDAEDLDIVMAMYNLLEYNENYSMTSESLWIYYRDKVNNDENVNGNANNGIINNKTITSKSFQYKTKIKGSTQNNNDILNTEFVVRSIYLSNFYRYLNLPLIYSEIELDFLLWKECIIFGVSRTFRAVGKPPVQQVATATTEATFQINNTKLYVPVLTLSINDNVKSLENIKQGFERTFSRNKYRSERTTQAKDNNLDYLIHPIFRNINRLFVF